MKKICTCFCILYCFLSAPSVAQGIYQLWGSLPGGGPNGAGIIFSSRFDGSGFAIKHPFTISTPGVPAPGNRLIQYNNKFYSLLAFGGSANNGMIGEYDQATNTWTRKVDLFTIKAGTYETGGLMVFNNKIYGLCGSGGNYDQGVLFEFTPFNGAITVLHHFNGTTGNRPKGYLTAYNNKLYGSTAYGGLQGEGVIFEFDPATNLYTRKADYNSASIGHVPAESFTIYNSKLWGVTEYGALNNGGSLFSFDPATSTLSKKLDFDAFAMKGASGGLAVLNDRLYVALEKNGGGSGCLFGYNPATNMGSVEHLLSWTDPHLQIGLTVYLNKLYGSAVLGGANQQGGIFSYDPAQNSFQTLLSFQNNTGAHGTGYLMLNNNMLYGLTQKEGNFGSGSLYAFDPINLQLQNLVHFGDASLKTPEGPMLYYNNKFYGTTSSGGTYRDGGIFEYDPATGIRVMKVSFNNTITGQVGSQGGFTLLNNKFFAVTGRGGAWASGTLLEYDPSSNTLTKRHDFQSATGDEPFAQLTVFNGKLYGTCSQGSSNQNGNIFEYDPLTFTYSQKVVMDPAKGIAPRGRMTLYNNKLYGVAPAGGVDNQGTLFEYNPAANSFIKRADFSPGLGSRPWGGLTVLNNKLYGGTTKGGNADSGSIYQFDPISSALTKKADLDYTTGSAPLNRFTSLNNKLYGMMNRGGSENLGALIEFDPVTSGIQVKKDFKRPDCTTPLTNELVAIPAPVAPGSANSCVNSQTITINAANAHEWIAFTDGEGRAVAEINANGNILGSTTVRFYTHSGATRQNGEGLYYLDRNISITRTNQPLTPVSIRLYIRKTEFDKLKATPGTGINTPADLSVYSNNDFCAANMTAALPLSSTQENWGLDYVYTADVMNLQSFYFAKIGSVLPVNLLSFTGKKESSCNLLSWQATCTQETMFSLEKSSDGIQFTNVYTLQASMQDCNQPLSYNDCNLSQGNSFYRLKMQETNGPVMYSQQVLIKRDGVMQAVLQLLPNPVIGNTAQVRITSILSATPVITVIDMTGKKIISKKIAVNAGINSIHLDLTAVAAGMYYLVYEDGSQREVVKMMKQ